MKKRFVSLFFALLMILLTAICVNAESLEENAGTLPFDFGKNLLISLIVGLVVALIVTGIMISKLKSVRKQHSANQYTKPGSLHITRATDLYLYSNVTRVRKAQNNSGSRSRF